MCKHFVEAIEYALELNYLHYREIMKKTISIAALLAASAVAVPAQANWFTDLFMPKSEPAAQQQTPSLSAVASDALAHNPLVKDTMSKLGMTQEQAQGGLGTILSLTKSTLGEQKFQSLTKDIPGADALLAAAPVLDKNSGMSGLLSEAGDLGKSFQGGAMVYDAFAKLGIAKEQAIPLINMLKEYLQKHSDNHAVALLSQGLNALL